MRGMHVGWAPFDRPHVSVLAAPPKRLAICPPPEDTADGNRLLQLVARPPSSLVPFKPGAACSLAMPPMQLLGTTDFQMLGSFSLGVGSSALGPPENAADDVHQSQIVARPPSALVPFMPGAPCSPPLPSTQLFGVDGFQMLGFSSHGVGSSALAELELAELHHPLWDLEGWQWPSLHGVRFLTWQSPPPPVVVDYPFRTLRILPPDSEMLETQAHAESVANAAVLQVSNPCRALTTLTIMPPDTEVTEVPACVEFAENAESSLTLPPLLPLLLCTLML